MTFQDVKNIAKRLDKKTQERIDDEVEERLAILREGDLDEEEMDRMEEYLYMSFILQEYLDSELDILEDDKKAILDEMEELYNDYSDLLVKAKLEKKLSKKKMMALELMKIREQLMMDKEYHKSINNRIKENIENQEKFKELSDKEIIKELAKEVKQEKKKGMDLDTKLQEQKRENNEIKQEVEKTKSNEVSKESKSEKRKETPKEDNKRKNEKDLSDALDDALANFNEEVENFNSAKRNYYKLANDAIKNAEIFPNDFMIQTETLLKQEQENDSRKL